MMVVRHRHEEREGGEKEGVGMLLFRFFVVRV